MLGVILKVDESNLYLDLSITPELIQQSFDVKAVHKLIENSEFKHFFIFDENIVDAIDSYKLAVPQNGKNVIQHRIGERQDSKVSFKILEDQLSAYVIITCGYAGKLPSVRAISNELTKAGIKKGIGTKRIKPLVEKANLGLPGDVFEVLIAKGMAPKAGRPSKLRPLVLNSLERILKPQTIDGTRVDMRNLGAIISVKKGTELLRRMPPTNGRNGFTVSGEVITAKGGEWVKFRPGDGTVLSDHDENLLVADISGMPKFKDQKMWVDDVFECKGVNVGSGNINYDGSVLVNGDVTEKMEIIATGDVTINGFVDSASIRADGDIIITEGAMGKVNENGTEYSTRLICKGSIHVQHGQGLDIICNGNVNVGRQLAHSRINCKGKVSVGAPDKPNGNIFSCTIKCQDSIIAGTLGAVAGSQLNVDFSEGFNTLLERKDTLDDFLKHIKQNNDRHLERMNLINAKIIPKDMQQRVDEANQLFQCEQQLLEWLEAKAKDMSAAKEKYQQNIQLIANKRIYPGVVVKLNNRTWRAEREYDRAKIHFHEHQWHYEPLI
jgi:uncharacterized protein (DUF342 family)